MPVGKTTSPIKKALPWWMSGWVLGTIAVWIALAIAFWSISVPLVGKWTTGTIIGVWFTAGTLLVLLLRRTILDTGYAIDEKVIEQTKRELEENRRKVRRQFHQREVELLMAGEKTPILDIWKVDGAYVNKHVFFDGVELKEIDPGVREFHLRLQIGDVARYGDDAATLERTLFNELKSFLNTVVKDKHFDSFRGFFDTLILEVYGMEEDSEKRDHPYPCLSLALTTKVFPTVFSPASTAGDLRRYGDLRWNSGLPVEPHRNLRCPTNARG